MTPLKLWLLIATTAVLLVGGYVLLKPGSSAPTAPAAPAVAREAPPAPAQPRELEFVMRGGELVTRPAALRVRQGDVVVIRVTSDRADELHLHGYDLHADLTAGAAAQLLFTADKAGRFELELHRSHRELGALEVQPN